MAPSIHIAQKRNMAQAHFAQVKIVRNVVIIAIFPKAFELEGFLCSLKNTEKYRIHFDEENQRECYIVELKHESGEGARALCIRCYVINCSDIEFSFRLGELLREITKPVTVPIGGTKVHVYLLGTAAASVKCLGDSFHVTSAMKVDRGVLTVEDEKLVMSDTNSSNAYSQPNFGMHSTMCTNHLKHCRIQDLIQTLRLKIDPKIKTNGWLMDMETYEFFKTCELNNVCSYQCFRLVSDVFLNEDHDEISNKARKCIKFDSLRDIFFDFIRATFGHLKLDNVWAPAAAQHHRMFVDKFLVRRDERIRGILEDRLVATRVLQYACGHTKDGNSGCIHPFVNRTADQHLSPQDLTSLTCASTAGLESAKTLLTELLEKTDRGRLQLQEFRREFAEVDQTNLHEAEKYFKDILGFTREVMTSAKRALVTVGDAKKRRGELSSLRVISGATEPHVADPDAALNGDIDAAQDDTVAEGKDGSC